MAYESAKTITEQGLESLGRYYSVYRAMVVNNTDPDHMNRIKVAYTRGNGRNSTLGLFKGSTWIYWVWF